MTIVLGNGCNIDCPHCYQIKNGDNLLRNKGVERTLRREFLQLYPYLETLRIQGGEVFALKGFEDLISDVTNTTSRPLISISTNGTLLNETWCHRVVDIPFQSMTFSFDAGTKATFEKMRRGANYKTVVDNVRRIQSIKKTKKSWYPVLDSFYVIMRSNYQEIPQFLELMLELEIHEASFQTLLVDERNLQREPELLTEQLVKLNEITDLHEILTQALNKYKDQFDSLSFSGLKNLFDNAGLSSDFLNEASSSLFPVQARTRYARKGVTKPNTPHYELPSPPSHFTQSHTNKQCPNAWTTMFITENGDVSLCFLSEPVANLYETPLAEIWNCPPAISKRTRMLVGKYTKSGCSKLWCEWRDGETTNALEDNSWHELLEYSQLLIKQLQHVAIKEDPEFDKNLGAVRRLIYMKNSRIKELEANLSLLWEDNEHLHKNGQTYIHKLEKRNDFLENKFIYLVLIRKIKQWIKRTISFRSPH